ncbi:hypothetical protein MAR_011627 [Mya arenaria]|uniref:Uncharacterized protein n=1 Tax=Mya arenaria TaxID=6604 RepID=A0ABY7FUL5_MYAAR|nr:hypothetical protein MAR_011627 [Mya arenaria]
MKLMLSSLYINRTVCFSLSKADTLKQKLITIFNTMSKHKKYGELHSHEQFIHSCEKQKQQEYGVEMGTLANDHCRKNLQIAYRANQKEIINLTKHLTRTKKVEQNITSVKESLQTLSTRLQQKERKCWSIVEKINDILPKVLQKRSLTKKLDRAFHNFNTASVLKCVMKITHFSIIVFLYLNLRWKCSIEINFSFKMLMSLKTDSDELRVLVVESSDVMRQFLTETSNLRIEGSLDSDQRRLQPDIT